jgi:ABC-type sugar transport system substrate-binding protein
MLLQNDTIADTPETTVILRGNKGSSPTIDRENGFREILQGNKQFQIVDSGYGDYSFSSGLKNMEAMLKKYGSKIRVIYAQNDDMAMGAIQAIKDYGLTPGKDILIIGTDATKQALQSVNNGEMYGTVECNPLLGPQLMDTVKKIMAGQKVPLQIIDPEDVYTKANVSLQLIFGRKY